MSVANTAQATFAATLVDEWIRAGVTDAVACPGSRSTPLVLALADRPELALHVRLDERSACFFALGLALRRHRPVVVVTTSGTAAAELHAGVLEAHHSGVPLIVSTADRPPELHDVGAPQTVDQAHLFGPAVRWFFDPGPPDAASAGTWRSLAARSVAESIGRTGRPGPVHLNLPFKEPLVGSPGDLPPGRAQGRPWIEVAGPPPPAEWPSLAGPAGRWRDRRGVLLAGAGAGSATDVVALAQTLGWPVLADPRSGCRVRRPGVVGAADAFLREPSVRRALLPEVVVLLGAPWASKVVAGYLAEAAAAGAEVVAVGSQWHWEDPDRLVARVWPWPPGVFARRLCHALGGEDSDAGDGPDGGRWLGRWVVVEAAAQSALDRALEADAAEGGRLSEPALARLLPGALPADATLVVASSMPVRDLEWYAPAVESPLRVLANRGVNGIDGTCSTALGAAAAGMGPVVAVVGDLAFLHDVSALVRPARAAGAGDSCTLVVVDNHGGGIFSFLPQAAEVAPGPFELLFGTPQLPSVVDVAAGFGLFVQDVGTSEELFAALAEVVGRHQLSVVRVRVPDRAANVDVHDRLHRAVAEAVAAALDR